jgi:hypothetical protein
MPELSIHAGAVTPSTTMPLLSLGLAAVCRKAWADRNRVRPVRKTSLSPKGLLDSEVFHVRSASRLSYSDCGANRARIENIRRRETGV